MTLHRLYLLKAVLPPQIWRKAKQKQQKQQQHPLMSVAAPPGVEGVGVSTNFRPQLPLPQKVSLLQAKLNLYALILAKSMLLLQIWTKTKQQ